MSFSVLRSRSGSGRGLLLLLVVASLLGMAIVPFGSIGVRGDTPPGHLVVSEIVTGGASASDELIELYNPTGEALPLEGLEVVYVSASGLSVSRRAAWSAGAADVPPGHHVLLANELGIYASIADVTYASGMAATGGSVALRIQGAATAIDAVGWGTAASTWMEGRPAPAPAAGSSLERLPGGALGSTQDTDDNLADFVERLLPDPQNSASAPTPDPDGPISTPAPTPTPPATPAPSATIAPSTEPTTAPDLTTIAVGAARAMPNGTTVTVEATALTGSGFAEGGGYVADATGGIAVLLTSGAYERGARLRVTGTIDDRFAQRTLRSSESQVIVLGAGIEPAPLPRETGLVNEAVEGSLVQVAGSIVGSPTTLSAGLAYDLDDGTGPTRIVVGPATGIETASWTPGSIVDLVGVVGQRDSSGTGAAGYRVQPRDAADVLAVGSPAPSATSPASLPPAGSPTPEASSSPTHVVSIAEARAAPKNTRLTVRGIVTMPPGIVAPTSAVIQDPTAAILLRVGDEAGPLSRGDRVEVSGMRSTLGGMETLRVTLPAKRLGSGSDPDATAVRTGDAGEAFEAQLVRARGAVVANARRVASGTVSFEIDDGSGPLRIYVAAPLAADPSGIAAGAWVEVTGVLGQETTGSQPLRGYRLWPRTPQDLRVGATPSSGDESPSGAGGGSGSTGGSSSTGAPASLASVGGSDPSQLRIGATLVVGPWAELGIGGLLWDGGRLVAIDGASSGAVERLLGRGRAPLAIELGGLRALGREASTGVPLVGLSTEPNDLAIATGGPVAPHAGLVDAGPPRWVTAVGHMTGNGERLRFRAGAVDADVRLLCDTGTSPAHGPASVTGIGLASPPRVIVPCGAIRPVPGLGAARSTARSQAAVAGMGAAASVQERDEEDDAPTAPAAAMLGAAGALLGAAALVRWRRIGHDDDPARTSVASGGEASQPASEAESEPMPRPLTLVRMPNERGSP